MLKIISVLFALMVVSFGGYFYTVSQDSTQECKNTLHKIYIELNLSLQSCDYTFGDVIASRSLDDAVQPKLKYIKTQEVIYDNRLEDYQSAYAEYNSLYQMAVAIGVPNLPVNDSYKPVGYIQNGLVLATQNQQILTTQLRNQIDDYNSKTQTED
jgi:hypothetical protein